MLFAAKPASSVTRHPPGASLSAAVPPWEGGFIRQSNLVLPAFRASTRGIESLPAVSDLLLDGEHERLVALDAKQHLILHEFSPGLSRFRGCRTSQGMMSVATKE